MLAWVMNLQFRGSEVGGLDVVAGGVYVTVYRRRRMR